MAHVTHLAFKALNAGGAKREAQRQVFGGGWL
jgi:hypothetical protein